MSFSADWLSLRAEADRRARDRTLEARLAAHLEGRTGVVLDLGSGTGANMAALAPVLGPGWRWRLVDNDAALLDRAAAPQGITVTRTVADLATGLGALITPEVGLVTASALFDLFGAARIDETARLTASAGVAFYTVLSYDGREHWEPPHPDDADVLAAFHADQCRDKGLGAAAGPSATETLRAAFEAEGYTVWTGASDWQLAQPADAALIAALAEGSAAAVAPALGERAAAWGAARGNAARVMIGHQDLLALPA